LRAPKAVERVAAFRLPVLALRGVLRAASAKKQIRFHGHG
jgi:hypothetical protein